MKLKRHEAVVVLLLLIACAFGAHSTGAQRQQGTPGTLSIEAPEVISAGDGLTVTVRSPVSENTDVLLGVSGSYGLLVLHAPIKSGVATFRVPPEQTTKSGVVTLTAAMRELHASGAITVAPGPAAEPLTPFIGAKSIVANGETWSMVVVIPTDRWGNPIAQGSALDLSLTRPSESNQTVSLYTDHLTVWTRITSGTVAGRTTVSAVASGAPGPLAVLEEVPGPPTRIAMTANPKQAPADGRSYLVLMTNELRDAHGNLVVDGTLVTFTATTADGQVFSIPGQTISGIAMARLLAPEQPGALTIVAESAGVVSAPAGVTFTEGPAVGTIAVQATVEGAELIIAAGPIVTALGDYAANGVTATFSVHGMGTGLEASAPIIAGHSNVSLPIIGLPSGDYEIVVTVGSATGITRITIAQE